MAHVHTPEGDMVVERRDQPKTLIDVFGGFEASHSVFPGARDGIVTLTPDASVARAFQTLAKHKILSAPILSSTGQVLGVISVMHLVSYMVRHLSPEELQSMDYSTLEEKRDHILNKSIRDIPDLQAIDKAHAIKEYQLAIDAAKLMIDDEDPARRVLVVDDNQKLVAIITQSRMLQIVSGVLDNLPDPAHRTLRETNLHKKQVITVKLNQPVADAFLLMREKNISAVAVVDDDQELLGVISASDLKYLGSDLSYVHLLGKTVKEYLSVLCGSLEESQRNVCTCDIDSTVGHAVKLLVARGLHRVFVVDNERKLVSVVSIRDILKTYLNPFMN